MCEFKFGCVSMDECVGGWVTRTRHQHMYTRTRWRTKASSHIFRIKVGLRNKWKNTAKRSKIFVGRMFHDINCEAFIALSLIFILELRHFSFDFLPNHVSHHLFSRIKVISKPAVLFTFQKSIGMKSPTMVAFRLKKKLKRCAGATFRCRAKHTHVHLHKKQLWITVERREGAV